MKNIKYIFILLIAFTITNCSDDNNKIVAFDFTTANLAGNYTINSLNESINNSATTQGGTVAVSTTNKVGDTFEVNLSIGVNGLFSIEGQHRVVTTETPVSGSPTTNAKIVNIVNSGTFSISDSNKRTITFIPNKGDFLSGEFTINLFNENKLTLKKIYKNDKINITEEGELTISFDKK